ncbi:MAG: hybrid sensor histidine kinase/response regulator [bacterium]
MQNSSSDKNIKGIWKTYDSSNGLTGGVWCIYQDKKDQLWIGTRTGVCSFDGQKFTPFEPEMENNVASICEDKHGNLWFGAWGCLICYDGKNIKKYTKENGLPSNFVRTLYEDKEGNIWIGTFNGLAYFDGQNFINCGKNYGLNNYMINTICEDQQGHIWIGTPDGIYCFYNGTFKKYTQKDRLIDNRILTICPHENKLWIGTISGAYVFNGNEFKTINIFDDVYVNFIYEDRQKRLWFATYDGVYYLDGDNFIKYTSNDGLLDNRVSYIFQDHENCLWFTHPFSGLTCFDPDTIEILSREPVTEVIYEDKKHRIWFGNERILYCVNEENYRTFNSRIFCILEDSKGFFWIGTQEDGLYRFDSSDNVWDSEPRQFTTEDGLGTNCVLSIMESSNGIIWAGTGRNGYLCRFDDERFNAIGVPVNTISRIFEDSKGQIWFGGWTGNGLLCYNGKEFKKYSVENGLLNDKIQSIIEDDSGSLWIGTQGELFSFNGREFLQYRKSQGFPSLFHQCSAKDSNGQLWFGTLSGGIYRTDGKHFQWLTKDNGILSNSITGLIPQRDGTMIIATYRGIVKYHPTAINPPKVFIKSVIADQVYQNPTKIELTIEKAGIVTIAYQGLSLTTSRLRYSYILEGYENEWHDTWETQVNYEKLPLGDYTFKVMAINHDFVYSQEQAVLELKISQNPLEKLRAEYNAEIKRLHKLFEINSKLNLQTNLSDTVRIVVEELKELGFDRAGVFINEFESNYIHGLWRTDLGDNIYRNENEILPPESIPPDNGYYVVTNEETMNKFGITEDHVFLFKDKDEQLFESIWGYPPPCPGFYHRSENGDKISLLIKAEDKVIGIITVDNYITKRNIDETSANLFSMIGTEMAKVLANVALRESLSAEKERLFVTLQSIGDGVIATDVDGKVTLMNKVAERLTGWSTEEAIGKQLEEIFHIINEKTREICENPVKKVIKDGEVVGLANNTVLISKDGTERIIADSGAPVRDKNGRIIGIILVFRDITERRIMEEELIRADKLETVSVLAGGIAHDFNNLLTGILGNVSLAKMQSNQWDKVYERLNEAEKASLRAKGLTQQLLTFSNGGDPILKVTSIAGLLKDSATFALRGSNVNCKFNIQDDLWAVEVDEGQISQVIHNIVINADQAMPSGGTITLTAENIVVGKKFHLPLKPGRYVKISIKDQGIGIPKAHFSKIFDPYFTTKQKGSGLGLSTSYSIIKRHDGYIALDSELGVGTTFYIYLPATTKPLTIDKEKEEQLEQIPKGKWKILVMDDEPVIRELAENLLTTLGYTVMVASDGEEAIKLYKAESKAGSPFDAVVMDLTIPGGLGGKEAIKELITFDPNIKAIASSGYSTEPVVSEYREYGFKGFIAKPYKIKDMADILYKVINKIEDELENS